MCVIFSPCFMSVSNMIIFHFVQLQASLVLMHLHIMMQIISVLLPANRSTLSISGISGTSCTPRFLDRLPVGLFKSTWGWWC